MTRHHAKTVRRMLPMILLALGLAVLPPVVFAGGAASQPPAGGQGDFVPVKDLPQQETIPAAPLVMGAYAFVWAALLVYVWTVWRRLLKVEQDVKQLDARLASKPGSRH